MRFKKLTAGFLAAVLAVMSLSEAVFAAPTAPATDTSVQSDVIEGSTEQEADYAASDEHHAYIGFQTANFSIRNVWNDITYGKDSGFFDKFIVWGGNDPETYPEYADKFVDDVGGSAGYVLDAEYNDATIDKDGTYTVSAKVDWAVDKSTGFNLLFVGTDIPADSGVVLSDAKVMMDGKVVIDVPGEIPTSDDIEDGATVKAIIDPDQKNGNNVLSLMFINIWNRLLEWFDSGEYPTDELAVQFTVSGIENISSDPEDNFTYEELDDGTIEITGYTGNATELEIPSIIDGQTVTSIGAEAFIDCSDLITIHIPDSVTNIGDWAFGYCLSLTSINIPDSVTSIGDSAFFCCSSLTSIDIPSNLTSIEYSTFSGCSSLTEINIPDGVTNIEVFAFNNCSSLTSIDIHDGVTNIGVDAFSFCSSLTSINVDDNNEYYSSQDGILFDKDMTELLACPGGKAGEYIIPDSVTYIWDQAFSGCSSLTEITIPDSVTSIGEGAFSSCNSLTSITIPDSVTSLGEGAFADCTSLTSIIIPYSVTSIGETAFPDCSSLISINVDDNNKYYSSQDGILFDKDMTKLLTYPGGKAGEYIIPGSVTGIGDYAFSDCSNLTSIDIPDSVTNIGECAFGDCSNLTSVKIAGSVKSIGYAAFIDCWSLEDVYYTGSKAQWDKIAIDEYNEDLLNATIHYDYSKVTAPSSVTGLNLKGRSGDALRLAWNKNTSADGYIIEMKDGTKWTRVAKITKNSTVEYRKDKLKAGTAYTFRIRAYKMDGKTALYSGYTTISARTNPSAVTGLKLKGRSGDALRISWTKNTSADGYIIEMKSGSTWTRVGKITKNSTVEFRKDKLKAGTAYSFRVKSYKMSGSTALYSGYTTISARTNPSAVSGLKLKNANSNAVRLAWSKNTSADGYIIEMKVNGTWTRVGKVTKNSTVEFRKGSLKSKTSYTFRIKAYKMSGKTALYSGYTTITVKTK